MGGTDDPNNLKELTVKQHATAHKKLYKKHGKWEDKIAWQMLSGQITNYEAKQQVRRLANLGKQHFLGKTHTDEYKKKLSLMMTERRKKNKNMGNFDKHSTKTKEKIAESLKGNKNKLGKKGPNKKPYKGKYTWLMGKNNPAKRPEVREKLRQAALNRKRVMFSS